MSEEHEQIAKSLAKKLLARKKLTSAKRDLLGSSDTHLALPKVSSRVESSTAILVS